MKRINKLVARYSLMGRYVIVGHKGIKRMARKIAKSNGGHAFGHMRNIKGKVKK